MSLFMSFYTMVDGLFVSNLIGTNALSAINLTAPVISLVTAVSTMLATGGSAVIMKKMGEGKEKEAQEDFTSLILINVAVGILMCLMGYACIDFIFSRMELSAAVTAYCIDYLENYLLFTVPILLMNNFSLYLIACGKSTLSFLCSVGGGITNIVLDYVFIHVLAMGTGGAAIATGPVSYTHLDVYKRQYQCHKPNSSYTWLIQFTGRNTADNVIVPVGYLLINVKPPILIKAPLHTIQLICISGICAYFVHLSGSHNHPFGIYQRCHLP